MDSDASAWKQRFERVLKIDNAFDVLHGVGVPGTFEAQRISLLQIMHDEFSGSEVLSVVLSVRGL